MACPPLPSAPPPRPTPSATVHASSLSDLHPGRAAHADSANMRSQGKLQLGTLMSEYGLMAQACAAEHEGSTTAGKVFFTRVEYTTAKDLFGRCGPCAVRRAVCVGGWLVCGGWGRGVRAVGVGLIGQCALAFT